MAWLNKNQPDEHITFIFDNKNDLVGAAAFSDQAGEYVDLLTIVINRKLCAKELSAMIFSFPTQTYGVIASLIPLFLKK